jgi:hypothetical protein
MRKANNDEEVRMDYNLLTWLSTVCENFQLLYTGKEAQISQSLLFVFTLAAMLFMVGN